MASSIILQNSLFTTILLPFLLVFLLVFAVLERTKIFGDNKTQLNAFTSFIMGLIVVAAFNYSGIINNLVLFLSIGLIVLFVALLLWGFISGETEFGFKTHGGMRTIFFVALILAIILGVLWAFGIPLYGGAGSVTNFLFSQVWSQPFWTNLIFIIVIGVVLAIVLGMGRKKS